MSPRAIRCKSVLRAKVLTIWVGIEMLRVGYLWEDEMQDKSLPCTTQQVKHAVLGGTSLTPHGVVEKARVRWGRG